MTPTPPNAKAVSFEMGKLMLSRSRFLGRISAFVFLLAAFSVFDGLQTLIRHEFNRIDLLPGETVFVSGMLPADAKSHEDLVVKMEGTPGLTFTPIETYKGFWMGGHMWRAELSAVSHMKPGKATVTIVDIINPEPESGEGKDSRDRAVLYGGQQNPALVHGVTIWASESERRGANHSFLLRLFSVQPFMLAAVCAALAIAVGIGNWRVFVFAEKALAVHEVFVVHGVKQMAVAARQALPGQHVSATSGIRVTFFHLGKHFNIGEPMVLLDRQWQEQGRGQILDIEKSKANALFADGTPFPRYGWLVTRAEKR